MPFSTHPPRVTQCIEILAPLSSTIHLILSTLTTLRLRTLLSTISTPSPTTHDAPLIRSASHLISRSKRQLTPFATLSMLSYTYLASSSYRLTKPVKICVDGVVWGECKHHSHPQEALLKLQWKIFAFSCVLVAFNLVWTVVEMPVITRDFAGGGAGKQQLLKNYLQERDRRETRPKRVCKSYTTDVSDPESIKRWLWCNRVREVLMLGAGIVGGLGWWMVPAGNRDLWWWID